MSGQWLLVSLLGEKVNYGDIDTIVREDEGGVGGCELGGRHCGFC